MTARLTDAGVEFLLDLLRIPFDATDRLWFFSDWCGEVRTFDERLWDHCMSHGVHPLPSRAIALDGVSGPVVP